MWQRTTLKSELLLCRWFKANVWMSWVVCNSTVVPTERQRTTDLDLSISTVWTQSFRQFASLFSTVLWICIFVSFSTWRAKSSSYFEIRLYAPGAGVSIKQLTKIKNLDKLWIIIIVNTSACVRDLLMESFTCRRINRNLATNWCKLFVTQLCERKRCDNIERKIYRPVCGPVFIYIPAESRCIYRRCIRWLLGQIQADYRLLCSRNTCHSWINYRRCN